MARWYLSLSEGEAGGAGGAADWVVELVVGPAVAVAVEQETRLVGTGRAVLFLLREAGGLEEDMVMVVVVLEA